MVLRALKTFSKPILGNEYTVKTLERWFKTVSSGSLPTPKYYFICSLPGNGKTHLIYYLSKKYDIPLVEIDSFSNSFSIESLSSRSLTNCTYKIVVVDNLDCFPTKEQKELYDLRNRITNPILYTVCYKSNLEKSISNDSNFLYLEKPSTEPLLSLLESIVREYSIDVGKEMLKRVAEESTSVRSAINSLFSQEVFDVMPIESKEDLYVKVLKGKEVGADFILLSYLVSNCYSVESLTHLSEFDLWFGRKQTTKIDGYTLQLVPKEKFNSTPSYPEFLQKMKYKPSDNSLYMKLARKLHTSSRCIPKEFNKLLYYLVRNDDDLLDMISSMQLQPREVRRLTKKKYIKKQHRKREPSTNNGKSLLQYF